MSGFGQSQWQLWSQFGHVLLDTPEKATDLAEAVVRVAFGPEQAREEQPFAATDLGDRWSVTGTNAGAHVTGFFPLRSTVVLDKRTGAVIDYELTGPDGAPKAPAPR